MICDLNTTLWNRGRVQADTLGITQPFSIAKAESGPPETCLVDILKIVLVCPNASLNDCAWAIYIPITGICYLGQITGQWFSHVNTIELRSQNIPLPKEQGQFTKQGHHLSSVSCQEEDWRGRWKSFKPHIGSPHP